MSKPLTSGFVWLEHSLIAFNGSGYADRRTAVTFLDSYIAYKRWKCKPKAARLAERLYRSALLVAEYLIINSDGPGRAPSERGRRQFSKFYQPGLNG